MAAVGEQRITYDARGLAEPFADVPQISEIDGNKARFDAQDVSDTIAELLRVRVLGEASRPAAPPPKVIPKTAETTGFGLYLMARVARWNVRTIRSISSQFCSTASIMSSIRFAPAEKCGP